MAVAQLPPPITAILSAVFIAAKIEKFDGYPAESGH
jgi:hypothetical protein